MQDTTTSSGNSEQLAGRRPASSNTVQPASVVVSYPYFAPPPEGRKIFVSEIFRELWGRRLRILISIGLAFVLGLVFLNLIVPQYTARIAIMPTNFQSNGSSLGGLGGLASKLGGLGNLQLSPGMAIDPFDQLVALVPSQTLAQTLMHDDRITHTIFKREWDERHHRWHAPGGIRDRITQFVRLLSGRRAWEPPSSDKLYRYLKSHITITENQTEPIYTYTYKYKDRAFAGYLLQRVHDEADQIVRQSAAVRCRAYLNYLYAKVQQATMLDLRASMIDLISQNEQNLMLVSANVPYAADIYEPLWVSESPTWPTVTATMAIFLILGFLLSSATVVFAVISRQLKSAVIADKSR